VGTAFRAGSTPEEKSKSLSSVGLGIVLNFLLFLFPRSPAVIVGVLIATFLVSIPYACGSGGIKPNGFRRFVFFSTHISACYWLGAALWPTVTIGPKKYTWQFQGTEIKFHLKNERQETVYSVTPLFRVSLPSAIPSLKITALFSSPRTDGNETGYLDTWGCENADGVFMIPVITHLNPGEEADISIKNVGDLKPTITVENPKYVLEPMPTGVTEISPGYFVHKEMFRTPIAGQCSPLLNGREIDR